MLYKNDELIRPDSEEFKKIKETVNQMVKKWPMIIKMPPYMYTKSEGNEKPDRPAYAVIPLIVQKNGPNGSEKWNYCTGREKVKENWSYYFTGNGNGGKSTSLTYTDTYTIQKDQIDLAYFLLEISPLRFILGEGEVSKKNRGVKPSQRFQFMIEDKELESAVNLKVRNQRRKIENAIMDEENGLSIDKIRVIASSLRIANAETKGELELKEELLAHVELMEKAGNHGYDEFNKLAKFDLITEIRAVIQKAVDMKLIKENGKEKAYFYVKDGKMTNKIAGVIGNRTMRESLEFHMEQSPNTFLELKQAIQEKEVELELTT